MYNFTDAKSFDKLLLIILLLVAAVVVCVDSSQKKQYCSALRDELWC